MKLLFHGKFEIIPFNIFGARVQYSCNRGFQLVGLRERICQGDGFWSGDPPTCQPDSHFVPTMPGYAEFKLQLVIFNIGFYTLNGH